MGEVFATLDNIGVTVARRVGQFTVVFRSSRHKQRHDGLVCGKTYVCSLLNTIFGPFRMGGGVFSNDFKMCLNVFPDSHVPNKRIVSHFRTNCFAEPDKKTRA